MISVKEELWARLATTLAGYDRLSSDQRCRNVTIDNDLHQLARLVAKVHQTKPPVTHSYDEDDESGLDNHPLSPITSPEKLTRVGPLPDEEPGYGSQRQRHRHLPDHLAACPAQLGGACTCPRSTSR